MVGRDVLGAPLPTGRHRERPRARGPPGTSAPTTHRAMSAHARHVRTRTPCAHLVRRDVLGAPLSTGRHRDAHGRAGRRGRRPLPRTAPRPHTHIARRTRTPCAPHTHAMRAPGRARRPRRAAPTERHRERPRARGPPGTSAPTTHRAMSAHARHVRTRTPCAHLVRRDVLGAPLSTGRHRDAHGRAGRRGRRPLPRTAPRPHTHIARRTRTPCAPHTHAMRAPGRARRPRRAAPTERHRERPRARGPPGTSAPTTHRAMSAHTHRAPHTHATSAHARHARTW